MTRLPWLALCLVSALAFAASGPSPQLSPAEREAIERRIVRFYASDAPGPLEERVPKYDATDGRPVEGNAFLRGDGSQEAGALERLAGVKARPSFQEDRCRRFLAPSFPELDCAGRGGTRRPVPDATILPNDLVATLAESWVTPGAVIGSLDRMPREGRARPGPWSGDYWRMRWGLTSYRQSGRVPYGTYAEAVSAYSEPAAWLALPFAIDPVSVPQITARFSPAEKYDLTVGDSEFTLTNEQKREGRGFVGNDGNVEPWIGLCHGWAAASLFVPAPKVPVHAIGLGGYAVIWYPDDIRAMATLAWAMGGYRSNFIGGRCNAQKPETYANGRLVQQDCFDTNPATFHLALGTFLGVAEVPFLADASFDYEVWNQPILSYETTYFDPLAPTRRSAAWRDVVAPYDARFKARDRFQRPLTRGRKTDWGYDDSAIRAIVGAVTSVVYLTGNGALHGPTPGPDLTMRATYTYDLELAAGPGGLVPTGGEWHENAHPDFLWVPRAGAAASRQNDSLTLGVSLERAPSDWIARVARATSPAGYPLCRVLKKLVDASSGSTGYVCAYGSE